MVKITVLYGPPTDTAAFEEHYANTHLPLAAKMPNVQRFEASRVVATPDGSEPPYYRMAEVWFASQEDLQATMSSPEGTATVQDIGSFATGGATVVIAEIDD
ncbi:MAG: EthD family reductase [Actinomycetota bacterium]|nr:EthD family reductase [Actinomycetota bacterium]